VTPVESELDWEGIRALAFLLVNFQAFRSRFSSAIRSSPRSPWTISWGSIKNSTWRAVSLAPSSAAIAWTTSDRQKDVGCSSVLRMRDSRSKSSIKIPIRCAS